MIKLLKAGLFNSTDKFKKAKETIHRYSNKYEIELYVDGEGESYVDGVCYPHQKDRILCVGPGLTRYSKKKFTCYYVHIQADHELAGVLEEVPTSFFASHYNMVKDAFREVISLAGKEENKLLLQSRLYELLHIILSDAKDKTKPEEKATGRSRTIQKAMGYIEEHYPEDICLKDIAEHVNFSPVYFHNVFKEYMGLTIHKYIEETRLNKAKEYLLSSDFSLEEIGLRCGYKSHSYFAYCFKRSEGITPTAFKKKNRGS